MTMTTADDDGRSRVGGVAAVAGRLGGARVRELRGVWSSRTRARSGYVGAGACKHQISRAGGLEPGRARVKRLPVREQNLLA
jgi:hypothetical protein